jgi:hypothetical protein
MDKGVLQPMSWYESPKFLELQKDFSYDLPEGILSRDSYLNLIWFIYDCGVTNGKKIVCEY